MNPEIRRLTPDEWLLWKALCLEMLQLHPESFGLSYEEALATSDEKWHEELTDDYILGAFVNSVLIGSAAFYPHKQTKTAHKGTLSDVYLKKEFRGKRGCAEHTMAAWRATNISRIC